MAITLDMRTKVAQLYVSLFGRAPEADGLGYWLSQWDNGTFKTVQEVAQAMYVANVNSATPFYPKLSTSEEIITKFYKNVMGRDSVDAGGMDYWSGQLKTKSVGTVVFDMITALLNSPTTDPVVAASKALFTNKVTVGLVYAVDKLGNDPVLAAQINAAVTATDTAAALAIINGSLNPGVSKDLTLNQDALVGTAGNDTFNALGKENANATLTDTLQSADTINGGAGVDTLNVTLNNNGTVTPVLTDVENVVLRATAASANLDLGSSTGVTNVTVKASSADTTTVSGVARIALGVANLGAGKFVQFNGATGSSRTLSLDTVGTSSSAVGVNISGAATTLNLTAKDATAMLSGEAYTTVNLTSNGSYNYIGVNGATSSLAKVTVTGAGFADLSANTFSALKTLTVGDGGSKVVSSYATTADGVFTTGAGNDTLTVEGAGVKTISTGAGNDSITIGGASLASTSSVDAGAGDDTVYFIGGNATYANAAGPMINGGDGVDTLRLTAANATAVSANGDFETVITGFERVRLDAVAADATATVNLANLDDISYVRTAGTTAGVAPSGGSYEVQTITFGALLNGQSVTVGGKTVTATADMTAAQVATAFATGTLTGYTMAVSSNVVTATATAFGNVATFVPSSSSPTPAAVVVVEKTAGTATIPAVTETATFTVAGLIDGETLTIAGRIITASGNATAADVAAALISGSTTGNAIVSGALSNYTVGGTGTSVVFTSTVAGPVTDLTAAIGSFVTTVAPVPVVVDGVTGVAGSNEVQTLTFAGLLNGQSVTVGGRVVTATGGDLTAAQVASAFHNGATAGAAVVSGALVGFTNTAVLGSSVDVTASATGNVALITTSGAGSTVATTTATSVDGAAGTAGTVGGVLNITKMANNGTLELNGAINGNSSVSMLDSSGTADTLNIRANGTGSGGLQNNATWTVAGVETLNITTTDSIVASVPTNPNSAAKLNLVAAAATTVKVAGNHGVNFTGSSLDAVTLLDASGVVSTGVTSSSSSTTIQTVGRVTFTSTNTTDAVTIKGGNGSDILSAATGSTKVVTIDGGAGNDTINGASGADVLVGGTGNDLITGKTGADTLTGGTGNDIFSFTAGDSTLAVKDVITDFVANTYGNGALGALPTFATGVSNPAGSNGDSTLWNGDVLKFNVSAEDGVFASVFANAADCQTYLQNLGESTDAANNNSFGAALDSTTGNLYIDLDSDGTIDMVIQLTGVTTITAAAFQLNSFAPPAPVAVELVGVVSADPIFLV
jgi:hypothetical protein